MKNITRIAFGQYANALARMNGVPEGTSSFAVLPEIEQKLEKRIQETSGFLSQINIVPVDEITGEKLGLGASGPIAGRTDTSANDRVPRDIHDLESQKYFCKKTDFDTFIKYATVDAWAKFPEFQHMMRDKVVEQIARDRLMIGFNGTSHAANTDLANNPMLQDVNIGWIEHMRTQAAKRVMTGAKIGDQDGKDYKNIDAAILDIVGELLEPWHRDASDLVVICGRSLVHDKYLALVNDNDKPTERNALESMMMNKQLGGIKTITVPYFPAKSVMVTPLGNLSIYYQEGSRRRTIMDNAKRDRIDDFQSVNEAYVVEDLGACCVLDAVVEPDGDGAWA